MKNSEVRKMELMGCAEIAVMLGLSKSAISFRYRKGKALNFPQPIVILRQGPIWTKQQILEWLNNEGRRYHGTCIK